MVVVVVVAAKRSISDGNDMISKVVLDSDGECRSVKKKSKLDSYFLYTVAIPILGADTHTYIQK